MTLWFLKTKVSFPIYFLKFKEENYSMIIGAPKEIKNNENRVAMPPPAGPMRFVNLDIQ